jgi:hypothetical protein
MRRCIYIGIFVSKVGMSMMIDDETSITYETAREMGIVRSVKNAWKEEVSQRRFSRGVLADALRDWRRGEHELIVKKDLIRKAKVKSFRKQSAI